MLSSARRIPRKAFSLLKRPAKTVHSPLFTLRAYSIPDNPQDRKPAHLPRIAVTVAKKEVKSAVKRNLLRRRYYAAFSVLFDKIPLAHDVHLQVRKSSLEKETKDIVQELMKSLGSPQ